MTALLTSARRALAASRRHLRATEASHSDLIERADRVIAELAAHQSERDGWEAEEETTQVEPMSMADLISGGAR